MNVRNDNRDLLVLLRYNYGVLPALPIGRGGVPRGGEGPFICQSVCLCGQCVVIDSSTGAKIVCTHASPSPLRVIPSRGVLSAVESRDYCAKTPQNFGPDQTAARPTPGPTNLPAPPRPSWHVAAWRLRRRVAGRRRCQPGHTPGGRMRDDGGGALSAITVSSRELVVRGAAGAGLVCVCV